MTLFVPPAVAAALRAESQQFEAEVMERVERDTTLERWDRELQSIDPHLFLVKAKEDTHGLPLRPGYYHLIRHNPGAPPSVTTIEGPNGEFVEPNSQVFELLLRNDLQRPGASRELKRQQEELERRRDRMRAQEREEITSEALERIKAGTRTFISMDRSQPWSQNTAGRRGRKR